MMVFKTIVEQIIIISLMKSNVLQVWKHWNPGFGIVIKVAKGLIYILS